MADSTYHLGEQTTETEGLKTFVRSIGIDLIGVANLGSLEGMPIGIRPGSTGFLESYRYAVVLGAQLHKLGVGAYCAIPN
jgi:hypothetical protein